MRNGSLDIGLMVSFQRGLALECGRCIAIGASSESGSLEVWESGSLEIWKRVLGVPLFREKRAL